MFCAGFPWCIKQINFFIIELLFLLNIMQLFYDDFFQMEISFVTVILDA